MSQDQSRPLAFCQPFEFLCHTCANFRSISIPSLVLKVADCAAFWSWMGVALVFAGILSCQLSRLRFRVWSGHLCYIVLKLPHITIKQSELQKHKQPQLPLFALVTLFLIHIAQVPHTTPWSKLKARPKKLCLWRCAGILLWDYHNWKGSCSVDVLSCIHMIKRKPFGRWLSGQLTAAEIMILRACQKCHGK
jgi:hypothetical protein